MEPHCLESFFSRLRVLVIFGPHPETMAIVTLNWPEPPPLDCRDGALTIGNFDGVHRGHLALLTETRRQATRLGGPTVAMTFDPHPLQLLRPERFQPVLTTAVDRAELLCANGADRVVILRTTPGLLQLTADEFFAQVIVRGLQARALVEGENFGFGRDRSGNVETLHALSHQAGIAFQIVPPFGVDGVAVSTSRVKDALLRGAVGTAATYLGRPYCLRGRVGTGESRGAGLGFPTANLTEAKTLIPGDGVYAVRAFLEDGARWPGAANVGPNPTFGGQTRKVEVHLIGYTGDLYGQVLAVDFVDRLRDTRPFAGVAQLVEQLRRDVEQAASLLGHGSLKS